MNQLKYSVKTFREAGLEAKWHKTVQGNPYIAVRNPKANLHHQKYEWWVVDANMWKSMQRDGIMEGFSSWTCLGDMFYTRMH